jgi:hypothetical protein
MVNQTALVLLASMAFVACPATPRKVDSPSGRGPSLVRGQAMPKLIGEERLADAVIDENTSGEVRRDVEELKTKLCQGRQYEPAIYYQLVVNREWHYYWVCSDSVVRRNATASGRRLLRQWLGELDGRVRGSLRNCDIDLQKSLFQQRHSSGVAATAYCDGRLIFGFPGGSSETRRVQPAKDATPCFR